MLAWVKAWHPAVRWGTALGLGLLALALLRSENAGYSTSSAGLEDAILASRSVGLTEAEVLEAAATAFHAALANAVQALAALGGGTDAAR